MKIKVDLHTHTMVSHHAFSTVTENATAASENGMEAIAITDHAPGMPDGAHQWHFDCLELIDRKINGVVVLRGAECSYTNADGKLDLPESTLKKMEVVIASVHTPAFCPETSEEHTKLLLKAMENPYIDILGHIDRVKCGGDYDLIAKSAKDYGKLIELNEHSLSYGGAEQTRKNTYALAEACMKYGTFVAVNSDSHYCRKIGNFELQKKLMDEIEFDPELVVNSSLSKFLDYMKGKKNIII